MKNIFIILCLCFVFGSANVRGKILGAVGSGQQGTSPYEKFAPKDVLDSAADLGKGMVKQIPPSIPTAGTILSYGKNMIAGLPVELGFNLINQACK